MTVPSRAFYYVLPANKCAVGRDALILPRRNLAVCNKRCKPFVGDDACMSGPVLSPHLKLRRPLKFPSSQKAYARAFRARHMLFLLSHYRQHRTIPALRLKHRSGSCGTASALPKCSIMSGCGTRIVLRGKAPRTLRPLPCFGSLFPPLAALTFAASSIICAFGLASAAPRSPYRHLELCGIAYKLIPPAPSDNNTPPTNPRRPHSFSCPGSGHTRAENRYTPCCLPL